MLNIFSHQGTANLYTTPLYRQWDGYNPGKGKTTSVNENVEPLEPSYITDENEK